MAGEAVWHPGTIEPGGLLRRLGGSLAHHVNNALTGVVGNLELALPHATPGTPAEHHLRASLACAYQAAESVRRIVGFACRGPVGEGTEPLSPWSILTDIEDRLGPWLPPGVELCLEGHNRALARGHAHLVTVVVESLVRNAQEAIGPTGKVTLQVEEQGGRCRIRVRDTGPGFSPAALHNLYVPFWTSKNGTHLGLGLVMAREIMQALDGELTVASVPGEGSTVTLDLPAEGAAHPVPERGSSLVAPPSSALGSMPAFAAG